MSASFDAVGAAPDPRDAVIVSAVRTPIGRRNGGLREIRPDDLLARVLVEVVERAGVATEQVEDVITGCSSPVGEQGLNIARNAALLAGFETSIPGITINRQCGSSEQAVHYAAQGVRSGAFDAVIASGVEVMSRVPIMSDGNGGPGPMINPAFFERFGDDFTPVGGIGGDRIARAWELSREELDGFGARSHQLAAAATAEGRFAREILPVEGVDREGAPATVRADEGVRPDTTAEKLAALKTVFSEAGPHTAGTSSQISDAAAALLVTSRAFAERHGLAVRAVIRGTAVVGVDPYLMLTGPIPATDKVLARSGAELGDVDVFEINEAFASVVLAWASEQGADLARVNPNGGAIALGHPTGAGGARLMTTLLHELERRDGRLGLQSMCVGFGQGTATVLERTAA